MTGSLGLCSNVYSMFLTSQSLQFHSVSLLMGQLLLDQPAWVASGLSQAVTLKCAVALKPFDFDLACECEVSADIPGAQRSHKSKPIRNGGERRREGGIPQSTVKHRARDKDTGSRTGRKAKA